MTPYSSPLLFLAYRMARGHEEVSNVKLGVEGGPPKKHLLQTV